MLQAGSKGKFMHSQPPLHFFCCLVTRAFCLSRVIPEDPVCAHVSFQRDAYFLPGIDQVSIFNHFPVGFEDFWIIHGIAEILFGNL
jgi:hypothetical protein